MLNLPTYKYTYMHIQNKKKIKLSFFFLTILNYLIYSHVNLCVSLAWEPHCAQCAGSGMSVVVKEGALNSKLPFKATLNHERAPEEPGLVFRNLSF